MAAAGALAASPAVLALVPVGSPVGAGRLHLGRGRAFVGEGSSLVVVVGFGAACWLATLDMSEPDLGRLTYRAETTLDGRGQAWLAVADRGEFEALAMPARIGGVLVVLTDDFGRRISSTS